MVQARDLSVTLNRRAILHGVDFTAHAGQVTAIVGPNGSGKTTLLRALIRDLPAAGRITMNGADVAGQPARVLALRRGVLPQATPLAFPFTALEVVRLGLTAGPAGGRPEVAEWALDRVGLLTHADSLFQQLSGGQQQRVQLARVLAQVPDPVFDGSPCWLYLDEPVSSLDIGHQLAVMEIARDFAAGGGGVIAVMHDLNLSAMFASRIALIAGGRVLGEGPPEDILTDPNLSAAYGCALRVNTAPPQGRWLLPQAAARVA